MKDVINRICFFLALSTSALTVTAQGPGGVSSGLMLWLKSDVGTSTTVDGANVSSWIDQSPQGNDGSQSSNNRRPIYLSNVWNTNPSLNFNTGQSNVRMNVANTADINLNSARSEISHMIAFSLDDDNTSDQVVYEQGGSVKGISMYVSNGRLYYVTYNLSGNVWPVTAVSVPVLSNTAYIAGFIFNGNASETGTVECYLNGDLVGTMNGIGILQSHSGGIGIGGVNSSPLNASGTTISGSSNLKGQISEIAIFDHALTASERNDVGSYLSTKWGVDYNASGHVHYNYSSYDDFMAGIGSESAISLLQSDGENRSEGAILRVNTPSSLNDNDYLVWGNDSGSTGTTLTGAHASYDERMVRIWRVTEVGDVGGITMQFDLTGLGYADNVVADFGLLIDGTNIDFSDASTIGGASFDGAILTFNNVNLSSGDFFTLGMPNGSGTPIFVSPGEVSADLQVWYRADLGTNTTVDGTPVGTWVNQGTAALNATQVNGGPLYRSNGLNNNPTIDFSTGNQWFKIPNTTLINLSDPRPEITHIVAFKTGASVQGRQVLYEQGGGTRGMNIYILDGSVFIGAWNTAQDGIGSNWSFLYTGGSIEPNSAYVVSLIYSGNDTNTGSILAYVNGVAFANINNVGFIYKHSGNIGIGAMNGGSRFESGSAGGGGNYFQGEIAEFINYATAKTDQERKDVETYLSVKYGIPLHPASHEIIPDGTSFSEGVAGIGKNLTLQSLNQTSSSTQQPGSVLTVSNPSAMVDGEYLAWGHNGELMKGQEDKKHPSYAQLLSRIWLFHEQNEVGTVDLRFDVSSVNFAGIPVLADFGLLVDPANANFNDATAIPATSYDGQYVTFVGVNLNSFNYVGLGIPVTVPSVLRAPGNVLDDLFVWYKGDRGTSTTTEGGTVTSWADQSGTGLDATGGSAIYSSSDINFNPSLTFSGGSMFTIPSDALINLASVKEENTILLAIETGADVSGRQVIFEEGGSTKGLNVYIFNDNLYFGAWNTSSDGNGAPWGGSYTSTPINPNTVYALMLQYDGNTAFSGQLRGYVNGSKVMEITTGIGRMYSHSDGNGLGGLNTGTRFENGGTSGTYDFNGKIMEFAYYGRSLKIVEQRNVNAYFAVRYGVDMNVANMNYYPNSLNAYSTNLVGIGMDDLEQDFTQAMSKSSGANAIMTLSNPSAMNDKDYMIMGHNATGLSNVSGSLPVGINNRTARIWRATETNSIGTISLSFDLAGNYCGDISDLYLLIDTDGDFSNATAITASSVTNFNYQFDGINLNSNDYVTLATSGQFGAYVPVTYRWIGNEDQVWAEPTNWESCSLPSNGDDVSISSVTGNMPSVITNTIVGDMTVESGATLATGTFNLDLSGDLIVDGSLTSSGTVSFVGSTAQQLNNSSVLQLYNLTANNVSGVSLAGQMVNIQNTVEVAAGTLTTNGQLTLQSSPSGTARIGQLTLGSISGDVIMERYIINSARNWRYLATPFTDTRVADWQDDFPITGGFTGGTEGPGLRHNPSIYRYDETFNDPVNLWDGYAAFPTVSNQELFTNSLGYATYIRQTSPLTMSTPGTIRTGTVNYPITHTSQPLVSAIGWNLVGNPYPSEIDWNAAQGWNKVGVDNAIYFTDNENGITVSYVNGISVPFGEANGVIGSHQAFWVKTNSPTAMMSSDERVKTEATHRFYRNTALDNLIYLNIVDQASGEEDQAAVYLDNNATAYYDGNADALKLSDNNGLRISSQSGDAEELVINGVDAFQEEMIIPLNVGVMHSGNFTLRLEGANNLTEDYDVFLVDYETGEVTDVSLQPEYDYYETTPGVKSSRFALRFSRPTVITGTIDELGSEISIFPNPTNGKFFVYRTSTENITVDILNTNGVIIASKESNESTISIDASLFEAGIYMVRLTSEEVTVTSRLVVK